MNMNWFKRTFMYNEQTEAAVVAHPTIREPVVSILKALKERPDTFEFTYLKEDWGNDNYRSRGLVKDTLTECWFVVTLHDNVGKKVWTSCFEATVVEAIIPVLSNNV